MIVLFYFLIALSFGFCDEIPVLLSNNGGKGFDYGLKYKYPFDKPTNPPDTIRNEANTFGNRLLNGDIYRNWWDPVGINYKDLTVDFSFPEKHRITEVKVKMERPQRPKYIEIYSKIDENSEWVNAGRIDVEGKDDIWFDFKFQNPMWMKDIRLIFRLKEWGFYIDEVEFWGITGYVEEKVTSVVEGKKLYIVKDGKPCARIVVPEQPKEKEKKAAQLLQHYIYEMTKVGLQVVTEDNKLEGSLIFVGNTKKSKEKFNIRQANYPEPERYVIKRDGNNIYIVGNDYGSFNGTVRSAYLFLENIGCKFYAPSKHWIVFPKTKNISVEDINIDFSPSFSHRDIWWSWEDFDPLAYGLGGVKGRYSHIYYSLIPPEKYYKEHPEYFALVDGRRQEKDAQICFSNPDVQKIIVEKAREFFDKNPEYVMFSLSANDCGGFCQCDECKKLGQNPSEQSLAFANIIAKELRKTHPDKNVIFYAYWYTAKAPENMKAEPNVFVMVINSTCKAHSLEDETCPNKKEWIDNFVKWKKTGAHLAIYEWYIPGCNVKEWGDTPFLPGENALKDLRLWKKLGVEWVHYESWHGEKRENFPIRFLMYYTIAKGMENVNVNYKEIVNQACKDLFGPASKEMAEFYTELSTCLDECKSHSFNWTPPRIQDVYPEEKMRKLRKLLALAMQKASDAEEEVVWRINDVMRSWLRFEEVWKNLHEKND